MLFWNVPMKECMKIKKGVNRMKSNEYYVTSLYPGKLVRREFDYLKSKGWKVVAWDCIKGTTPVKIVCPDRYTVVVQMEKGE